MFTRRFALLFAPALLLAVSSAVGAEAKKRGSMMTLDQMAESYVRLCLAAGVHDRDFVDAYHGPSEWQQQAKDEKLPLPEIQERARALSQALAGAAGGGLDDLTRRRRDALDRHVAAMEARLEFLQGRRLAFDEESRRLFDAVAPTYPEDHFKRLLAQVGEALPPGPGSAADRFEAFRRAFIIPRDRVDAVFRAAVAAARARTLKHLPLPEGESFQIEYVTDKPWSGYNWYQGGYRSLIQVNTSLPIYIDRALDLACHEGYPGHHAYNVLMEQKLLRERGWVEYSVYALFSPQSLIAEGTANYGIDVVFSEEERMAFERDVLFPVAGLDPSRVGEYQRVTRLAKQLAFAGNEAARRYLQGEIDAAAAAGWLNRYALMEPARAEQRVRFIDKYRSYVINYNWGEELVRRHAEARVERGEDRWQVFRELISTPVLPSRLH